MTARTANTDAEIHVFVPEVIGNEFTRGDADANGDYFPLLDALYILANGFNGGPTPPCKDAADSDNNGDYFPLLDALYILSNGFNGGPSPAAPRSTPNCSASAPPTTPTI